MHLGTTGDCALYTYRQTHYFLYMIGQSPEIKNMVKKQTFEEKTNRFV